MHAHDLARLLRAYYVNLLQNFRSEPVSMSNTSSTYCSVCTYDIHKNGVWSSCMKRNPAPNAWKHGFTGMHAYYQHNTVSIHGVARGFNTRRNRIHTCTRHQLQLYIQLPVYHVGGNAEIRTDNSRQQAGSSHFSI